MMKSANVQYNFHLCIVTETDFVLVGQNTECKAFESDYMGTSVHAMVVDLNKSSKKDCEKGTDRKKDVEVE